MTEETKDTGLTQLDDQLIALVEKAVPLATALSAKIGTLVVMGGVATAWLFAYLFWFNGWGLWFSLITVSMVVVPLLILTRFYFSLKGLRDLPDALSALTDDVGDAVQALKQPQKGNKRQALNVKGSAGGLFELKSLLGNADEMLEQYVNIGALINPFSLILAVISLGVTAVGILIAVIALLFFIL